MSFALTRPCKTNWLKDHDPDGTLAVQRDTALEHLDDPLLAE
jgi:hypothetical protein